MGLGRREPGAERLGLGLGLEYRDGGLQCRYVLHYVGEWEEDVEQHEPGLEHLELVDERRKLGVGDQCPDVQYHSVLLAAAGWVEEGVEHR